MYATHLCVARHATKRPVFIRSSLVALLLMPMPAIFLKKKHRDDVYDDHAVDRICTVKTICSFMMRCKMTDGGRVALMEKQGGRVVTEHT